MKALVYGEALRLAGDYPRPEPGPGEALVRVDLAGICNTDLEIMRGYMGFRGVLGHEFVGVVEAAGDAAWLGRRVVGEINCACGHCATCRAGRPTHCPNRTTVGIDRHDGAFAEYVRLPLANLHAVPPGVSDRQAVFAEPLAAALEIPEQAHIRPTERVAVVGDGKLGLLVAQVLALLGVELTAIGRHEDKLAILRRRGVAACLEGDVPSALERACDVVVDCTGKAEGFALARRLVRPRGRLVLKSTFHGKNEVDLTGAVVDEVALLGSRCGPFAPALRLLERGLVDVESLVDSEYVLDDGLRAFERAATRGALKVLVRP
ncbi:MAG TPA: alcohol dehydrogenase catalytic domain-containing protein [Anaerolineae bacterium]|nr:alcohol dehydrogenase catalytic domain-containing protein [Anaerolineae bacterium]HOQ98745.1 alcohol dehydrogenase catalytic domain-containing protein [Anaerolineae bacterium]HPL28328.1 alcohol dehydrogenase catalytic domain-containing protein [Anaerolineae bacterium]